VGRVLKVCVLFELICIASCPAYCKSKEPIPCNESIQKRLTPIFKLIDPKHALFEVNTDYVLQVLCESNGEIVTIHVDPKHYFQNLHPEWEAPDEKVRMPHSNFDAILERIENVKSLGKLEEECSVIYFSNGNGPCWERHTGGFVDRWDLTYPYDLEGNPVVSFTIYFFRIVSRKVQEKRADEGCCPDNPPPAREFRVKLGGRWYWTKEKEFNEAKEGKRIRISVAGPFGV
jgi:hypothetical protein